MVLVFVFYCIIFILYFIVTCANVICIKFLLAYLLSMLFCANVYYSVFSVHLYIVGFAFCGSPGITAGWSDGQMGWAGHVAGRRRWLVWSAANTGLGV